MKQSPNRSPCPAKRALSAGQIRARILALKAEKLGTYETLEMAATGETGMAAARAAAVEVIALEDSRRTSLHRLVP
jgi:hypothetical protein